MSSVISSTGRRPALLIAGILLIATTLRVVFTGAAPLLDAIRSDYGLTTAQTGLLTTLPLLAFGLVSPLAAGVARRFGMERSLLLAMLLICAGIALRSLPSAALLFIGTAVIGCGIALVRGQKQQGVQLLATGEMGIGNTTTSSAVASVLLGAPVQSMTGRGAGLSDAGLARKIDAIRRGIAHNQPNPADPLDVLAKLGGFDIAGLCGVFLGGARYRVPIIMDGFISGVAALCAVRLCENAKKAVFASHVSSEPAANLVLNALGKKPLLTAGMHLGEGTGAVASIPLWDMAIAVYQGCYSFSEGGIEPYKPQC